MQPETHEIKGLSVRQPWAWAIAIGAKPVENRTRPTKYRGLLAIHAGKAVDRGALGEPGVLTAIMMKEFEIDEATSRLGAVVAVAELRNCHHADECRRSSSLLCSEWAIDGQFHWVLAGVRPLPEPVPCKGMLGLWRLPEDVERAVTGQRSNGATEVAIRASPSLRSGDA